MRILICGINYAPELTGTGKYTGEMAEALATDGNCVRVVTAPPYYPEWRVQKPYSSWLYCKERKGGCKVWRCPVWVPREPRGVTRILHLLSFAASSAPVVLMHLIWRPHVVLVVAPTLFSAPAAWIMARLNGAITWLHVQDFELDVAMNLGMVQGDLAQGIASAVEHFWFRRFDRVSTISNKMIERLHEKGVPAKKIVSLPNWVDTEAIYPLMRPSIFRQTLGLNESDFVALYAGNMGEKQGLEIIVEAARKLERRSDVVLVLAGAGAAKARLESQVKGLTNVRWLPLQPTERLNDLLNLANVHLLPQRSGAADLVMPSKLTGMLASGRPIIATAERGTQIAEVVTLCGCVVPPGSADPLVKALLDLCRNREKRIALGKRARAYACERLAKPVILSKAADQLAAAVSEKQKT